MYEVDGLKIYIYKDAEPETGRVTIDRAKHISDLANQEFDIEGLKI